MTLWLYTIATRCASLFGPYILNRRTKRGKEDSARRHERLGRPEMARPDGTLIWVHAASIGESVSILPLVDRLLMEDADRTIMVTTGTVTAAAIMEDRLPDRAFHQFIPLDFPAAVQRFLNHWKPDAALFVEQELWPNLIVQTRMADIPLVLINGRMSEQSAASWKKAPKGIRNAIFNSFDLILAQDEQSADRFAGLTSRPVSHTGNLKYAAATLGVDDNELAAIKTQIGDRPVWVAASVHPGEEDHICATHKALQLDHPDLLTIIVPRHADKASLFAGACRNDHLVTRLRSQLQSKGLGKAHVLIGDTMGEMGLYYRLASIVFMGGSLIPHGGQNPLEPARLGNAILFGPHIENFTEPFDDLTHAGGAKQVYSGATLATEIDTLLTNPDACKQMGQTAAQAANHHAGSIDRIMERISPIIKKKGATS